jgi:hypothetical protein
MYVVDPFQPGVSGEAFLYQHRYNRVSFPPNPTPPGPLVLDAERINFELYIEFEAGCFCRSAEQAPVNTQPQLP